MTRERYLRRGSAAAMGYGYDWRLFRERFLQEFPLCGDRHPDAPPTTDSQCRADGRVSPAVVVDHIRPITGKHDPTRLQITAVQGLCRPCDARKRQRESMAAR